MERSDFIAEIEKCKRKQQFFHDQLPSPGNQASGSELDAVRRFMESQGVRVLVVEVDGVKVLYQAQG